MKKIFANKIFLNFYAVLSISATFLAPVSFANAQLIESYQPIQPSLAPNVYTGSAINIIKNTVTLTGSVNYPANIGNCPWVWFEYSTNSQLTNSSIIGYQAYCNVYYVSADLRDLQPSTTYYYRIVAQNSYGAVKGYVQSFKTQTAASGQAPLVYTNAVSSIVNDSVNLSGTVNPNYLYTNAWFEYGIDRSLDFIAGYQQSIGNGGDNQNISTYLQNLQPNTTYYYRVAAQNSNGTSYGEILSFYNQFPSLILSTPGISSAPVISTPSVPTQSIQATNDYFPSKPVSTVKKSAKKIGPELIFLDPQIDNENPSAGDEINYSVIYRNIGKNAASNGILTVIFPEDVRYESSSANAVISGNNLSFKLGTLKSQSHDTVNVKLRIKNLTKSGTALVFGSVLNYSDYENNSRSTNSYLVVSVERGASVSASLIDVLGSLVASWLFDIAVGLALGFGIYRFFIKSKETDLAG